ncbi:MAG: dipeptide epimerase [Chitinophagaceae bacterium]|nr:MAG: dipeptide epimerase [Chitinophagaceae bacterium]
MRLWYRTYELPFRDPFTISKGTKTHQPTLIVALEHLGHVGFGEAPAISYYNVSTDSLVADLERKKIFVEKFAFTEPERYWHYLHHLYPANPFLVCALDMAGWDLFGKMKRRPLNDFWKPAQPLAPVTDFTIGIDSIDRMVEKLKAKPWPLYKIKLGSGNDIGIIQELRKHTDAPFRVDANAAWTVDEAAEKIAALAHLGVELVEQPLAKDDWEGMKQLMQTSPLPLIADESCVKEEDVERCAGYFHGINIKLTKCSGITPALRMIENARKLGLRVMIGSMNESTVGSAAIAHLSSLADYIDADGPLLLSQDLATGLDYGTDGRISTSAAPGLGIGFQAEPFDK